MRVVKRFIKREEVELDVFENPECMPNNYFLYLVVGDETIFIGHYSDLGYIEGIVKLIDFLYLGDNRDYVDDLLFRGRVLDMWEANNEVKEKDK